MAHATRAELTNVLSAFQSAWDTTMEELDELTSLPGFPEAELDPNNEERIVKLNEELCNLATSGCRQPTPLSALHDKETENATN